MPPPANDRRITDAAALDAAFAAPLFVLFKHSPACPISARAEAEWEAFRAEHPDAPTGWIDVLAEAELARDVARRTGVEHASPQVLLLRDGRAVWDASHFSVSARRLGKALARA